MIDIIKLDSLTNLLAQCEYNRLHPHNRTIERISWDIHGFTHETIFVQEV